MIKITKEIVEEHGINSEEYDTLSGFIISSIGRIPKNQEVIYLNDKSNIIDDEYLYVSSMRASRIYIIKTNNKFNKLIEEDRIFFPEQRIRDIEYDKTNNVFFLLFDSIPSLGVLKLDK